MYLLPAAPFSEAVYPMGPGTMGNALMVFLIIVQLAMYVVPMFLGAWYEHSQAKRRLVTQEPTQVIELPSLDQQMTTEHQQAMERQRAIERERALEESRRRAA